MKKNDEATLRRFQCEFNRNIEETFAQVLTENDQVRLFFINGDQAFTDGRNIVVDPAIGEVFADKNALIRTESYLQIGHHISSDTWHALRMITRGQNIHECLHILYSDLPIRVNADDRATSKARKKTLALICNIIEDAFIEAVGCSVYDNLELFLKFERVATLFSNTPIEGTVDRAFRNETDEAPEPLPITEYLSYMATFLLYPMVVQQEAPEHIASYVERTKKLFLDGSICGEPKARYRFTQEIFDIIEAIVPDNENNLDDDLFKRMMPGIKTHSGDDKTIGTYQSTGKTVSVARRMFADIHGNELEKRDFQEQIAVIVGNYETEKNAAMDIVLTEPIVVKWNASQFDCAKVHRDIEVIETKPKPNLNMRRAYLNIYHKYHININSYNSRFIQLLKARIPVREEKKLFGSGITSTRLADVKKRYWHRNAEDYGIPDIAVLLLIDGSGSMSGARRESAMISSVILHEVLKKQGIIHAVVEHRAGFGEPIVKVNILVGFNARDEEKLNLMTLAAGGDNRDGLALFWAERFLVANTTCAQRLIIVLADGFPSHDYDEYYPPVSTKDTANAAAKIVNRGTDIIAVALDDGNDETHVCYDALKEIYPSVVSCTNLKRLTGQLLGIISRNLM